MCSGITWFDKIKFVFYDERFIKDVRWDEKNGRNDVIETMKQWWIKLFNQNGKYKPWLKNFDENKMIYLMKCDNVIIFKVTILGTILGDVLSQASWVKLLKCKKDDWFWKPGSSPI